MLQDEEDIFTVLGIGVPVSNDVHKSGTSFATSIAAGMAANILEDANYRCSLNYYEREHLQSFSGI